MRIFTHTVLTVLLILCLFACQSSPETPQPSPSPGLTGKGTGAIKGRVTQEAIKTAAEAPGLSEARIYLEDTLQETRTDAEGKFELRDVPVGSHALVAEKSEDGKNFKLRQQVPVSAGETVDLKSLLLKKTGTIVGLAKLNGKENHLGIDVFIAGSPIVAKTEAGGDYVIIDVPEGTYTLSATKSGYRPQQVDDIVVRSGEPTRARNFELSEDKKTLEQGRISGQVTGEDKPLVGATVSVKGPNSFQNVTITGEQGDYSLVNLEAGEYTLRVFANGFKAQIQTVTVQKDNPTETQVTLEPDGSQKGTLRGTIKDKAGQPLSGIIIKTTPPLGEPKSGDQGQFEFVNVPPGTYEIRAEQDGKKIAREVRTIQAGPPVDVELQQNDSLLPPLQSTQSSENTVPFSATIIATDAATTLSVGSTVFLRAVATLEDKKTSGDIIWSSSDDSVASVDSEGKVTGNRPGSVLIAVMVKKAPSKSASILIKVVDPSEKDKK